MKTGIELITDERKRQTDVEGWNRSHDDYFHDQMQMTDAAGCYLASAANKQLNEGVLSRYQIKNMNKKWVDGWPWDEKYDKREKHDVIRSLVIAGALIAAEIDRLQQISGENE